MIQKKIESSQQKDLQERPQWKSDITLAEKSQTYCNSKSTN